MTSQIRSLAPLAAASAALASLALASLAHAQGIPNPLVRPQRGAETVATQQQPAAAPAASQRGATAAPSGRAAAAAGRGGEGLPAEGRGEEKTVAELLGGLYVSTVIGDRAVLRSLDVRTVPGLASNLGAAVGAGAGGAGAAAGGGGGGGGGGNTGSNTGIAGLRSQVYIVRNGEVMSLLDRLRVLVRVRDTTVTLFDVTDIPPGQYDPLDLMDRGFPVAFRGSVDSMQSLPPTPGTLIRPGEGVDGEAFQRARNTSGNNSGGGNTNTRTNTGGGGGGLNNP
jgi:hypothetical protein